MKARKWFGDNWVSLPIIIALILLAIALFTNPVGFQNLAWYGLVALTAIYAYGTMRLVRENKRTIEEMKQSRLDAVKPSLSLQPGDFTIGGGFSGLYLANSGGVAKDVKVDIEMAKCESRKSLFVPAIDAQHWVYLGAVAKPQGQTGVIRVHIEFRDGYNQPLSESLSMDFSDLQGENREVLGQYSDLHQIKMSLEQLVSEIRRKNR
jgi:hypothetical protein